MNKKNYNFESFIEKHKNTKYFGKKIIIEKSEVKKHFRGFLVDSGLKKIIKTEFEKILFGFRNSFVVFEDGVVPSHLGTNGKKYSFKEVRDFTVKKTGFITSGHWFDKLKIFKSDHEREVSEQLSNIEIGIYELISSIRSMEKNVVEELSYLSYVTESSFQDLSESVTEQLSSINSSIKFNNLLTGIQTYQIYKINQNTKSFRG